VQKQFRKQRRVVPHLRAIFTSSAKAHDSLRPGNRTHRA
jgi:hypothetical protein